MITVRRSSRPRKGTPWFPAEHSIEQRRVIESVRREVPGEQRDKTIVRQQTVNLDALDLLLAGSDRTYSRARIEDPYKRGQFIDSFIYVRALAAFIHEDEVAHFETFPHRIGPGAIIGKAVRIEPGAHVGEFTELEQGAAVMGGAAVGANSIVRKGARIGEHVTVGAHSYIGQFAQLRADAELGSMSLVGRKAYLGARVHAGTQNGVGVGTYVGPDSWLGDTVRVGRYSHVGHDVTIGEMSSLGNRNHIGATSHIGAESEFGDFVRVAQNVWLVSPTYADDGAFIQHSNLFSRRPEQP